MTSEYFLKGAPLSEEAFRNPPRELGVLPFWFWNADLKPGELKRQILQFKEKGLAGLFLHARFGLQVPFLSKRWFARVRLAAEEASKLGLQCWIYDEYNWPSGTAHRQIPARYPHLQQRYLQLLVEDVPGPTFIFLEGYDSRYLEISDGRMKPLAAFAVPAEEWERGTISHLIDLTPNLAFGKVISWQAPPGKWKILYFMEKQAPWYIDALNPESTARFLEMGYESYARALPELLGSLISGFYTDEPAMHYYANTQDNYIIPWTADMFTLFREANGYDLKPWLCCLFADMGENPAKVRYDFWSALSRRYEKAYYRQLRDWCHSRGLLFVGHLLFEEHLRISARCSGNLFWMLRNLDIVGTDHLYPRIGTPQQPTEHVALKIASSAAHHFACARVLCESLGGTYWDCTMARMKWLADWEFVLGINLFNPHGFHYSIAGDRKRDWPPSQFYHHPWWKHYRLFADYLLRLAYMLSGGRHVARIALLYPLTTIWANYLPQRGKPASDLCERDFNYLTDTLLRLHFDYDYVEEETLAKAEVSAGKLHLGEEAYDLLLLPPITHLRRESLEKMEALLRAGGKVLACCLLPNETTSGEKIGKRIRELFGLDPEEERRKWEKGWAALETTENRLPGGGRAVFLRSGGLHQAADEEALRRLLAGLVQPDVELEEGEIFCLHRVKDGRHVYFLANTAWTRKQSKLRIYAPGKPQRWNPEDGSIKPIYHYRPIDGGVEIPLHLEELESALIVTAGEPDIAVLEGNVCVEAVRDGEIIATGRPSGTAWLRILLGKEEKTLAAPAGDLLPELAIEKWEVKAEDDNALVLSNWLLQVEGEEAAGWVAVRPGAWEPQFPYEQGPSRYPVQLHYKSRFICQYLPDNLRLLLDGLEGSHEIFLNGRLVKGKTRRSKLDVNIRELPISAYLREGENILEIGLRTDSPSGGLLDPVRLVGAFSVSEKGDLPAIVAPISKVAAGSLVNQGYPYFSGTISYQAEINIGKEHLRERKLVLEAKCGTDVMEVEINGRAAGTRPWPPYRVDISALARRGKNRLAIRLTNTLTNLLEGKPLDFGLLEPVRLVTYNIYRFPTARLRMATGKRDLQHGQRALQNA